MIPPDNSEEIRETSRLLSELDSAIDRSSVMRDIVNKYERLRSIESITGPSPFTRILRKEIQILEGRLGKLRGDAQAKQDAICSPT
ncbi:MAG: hypothetical protein OEN02_08725 [Gammaproteobacteria bacterium]|nr:hypothetical protein [Gammaproteobacteria bacterium]MDH3534775.1 hypothetical protein [Gammaproteobacteria bacterium]